MTGRLPPPSAGTAQTPRRNGLFISYARPDAGVVGKLHEHFEQMGREVWFDRDLQGGQQWWDIILERILAADVFVFALSPDSVKSGACRAELSYAAALHKPILPVRLRPTDEKLAPDLIGTTQIVDYRERTPETATALTVAVVELTGTGVLPDPLPPPPPAPVSDLAPVSERLASRRLLFEEQQELVVELWRQIDNHDQLESLLELTEQFRARGDLADAVKKDLHELVKKISAVLADGAVRDHGSGQPIRPLRELPQETVDLLRSLAVHIDNDHFTPIIGWGMMESLVGPPGYLVDEWARNFETPTKLRRRNDLPQAAQFVEVMNGTAALRTALTKDLRSLVLKVHGETVADAQGEEFDELLTAAWMAQRSRSDQDPHAALAALPCRIYVTAHPFGLMVEALREAGKDPVVEMCRWRPDVYDWPPSALETESGYEPSVRRPLVFQVFGTVDCPDSLVLSADDYLDFMVSVARDPSLIPQPVRSALSDSALLLLGFGLEELDVRVLLRAFSQEGGHKLTKYSHVGAQSPFTPGGEGPAREHTYLERYLGRHRSMNRQASIDIFWGTVEEFTSGLAELRSADGGVPR